MKITINYKWLIHFSPKQQTLKTIFRIYLYHALFSFSVAASENPSIHSSLSLFLCPLSNDSVQGPPTLYICSIDKDLTWIQSQTPWQTHTGTHTHVHAHAPSPLQWRALINSQGVHVVVASGAIKRPSEPSQETGGFGEGQRGSRCRPCIFLASGELASWPPYRSLPSPSLSSSLFFLSVAIPLASTWLDH